jgi:hypothetical protein
MSLYRKAFVHFSLFYLLIFASALAFGQDRATGSIKGRVSTEKKDASGVLVIARQNDTEAARAETNRRGEFLLSGLAPGAYTLSFRKEGLSAVVSRKQVQVVAGKTLDFGKVVMPLDRGSLVLIRCTVFKEGGVLARGVPVEIARIGENGSLKKIETRVTNDDGDTEFRLPPGANRYRVTAKVGNYPPISKDVSVEAPARYSVALSVQNEQTKQ